MSSNREDWHEDEDSTRDRSARARMRGSILLGVGLVALGHVVACFGAAALGSLFGNAEAGLAWLMFLGVTQFVHVIPLAVWMRNRNQARTAKGIWLGAGITALLAAACFGFAMSNFG